MPKIYALDCPVARTLDLIGEKWTILVLRDLLRGGPQRFQDLEASLENLPPSTLSARLKTLEQAGIVTTEQYETHPPRFRYVLTPKGKALGPVLLSIRKWGQRYAGK